MFDGSSAARLESTTDGGAGVSPASSRLSTSETPIPPIRQTELGRATARNFTVEPYPSVSAALAAFVGVLIAWGGTFTSFGFAYFGDWVGPVIIVFVAAPMLLAPISLYIGWRTRASDTALMLGLCALAPFVLGAIAAIAQNWLAAILSLAAGATQFAACYVPARVMVSRWRRRLDPARGRCPACGYSLEGLRASGCPECGWGRSDALQSADSSD